MEIKYRGGKIDLTEDEAVSLFLEMAGAFEWQGTIFRRKDIEDTIERPLTDDEWDKITSVWEWHSGIPELLTERGWEIIDGILGELGIETVE